MAFFTVTASQRGNKVTFEIGAENDYPNNIKEALVLAHDEANQIFGYEIGSGKTDIPTVSVKEILSVTKGNPSSE